MGGIILSTGHLKRKKWSLLLPACLLTWDVGLLLPLDGLYPLTPLVCRPLDMEWNYNTNFPVSPACRWQIMGLLSLPNRVTQFLIINFFLYIFC